MANRRQSATGFHAAALRQSVGVGDALKVPIRGAFSQPPRVKAVDPLRDKKTDGVDQYGYVPLYTVTPKILDRIVQTERFRGFILGAKLSPQWIKKMQGQALVTEAHHTTHIEGTTLSLAQSEYLLRGFDIPQADPNDVRELLNYRRAFLLVSDELGKGIPVTEMMLREVHRRLVEGVRGDRAVPGEYRTVQNYIANSKTGEVVYEPPAAYEVARLMNELIQWLRSEDGTNPIIKAGIAQFQLVHIHPFLDGNGRTARLLSTLVLYSAGYDFKKLFSISQFYDEDKAAYYKALQSVRECKMDLTQWLEYFVLGLASQMANVQKKAETAMKADVLSMAFNLNKRQTSAVNWLLEKQVLSMDDLAALHPEVARSTLQRDLAQMCSFELVKRERVGKCGLYVLHTRKAKIQ